MQGILSRLGYSILLAMVLVSCDYTPISTMLALRKVDFETTPARDLRVKLVLPHKIRPRENSIVMKGTLSATDSLPEEVVVFYLEEKQSEQSAFQESQKKQVFVYGLAEPDIAGFDSFRLKASKKKERNGSISVDAEACRLTSEPITQLVGSIFLKTAELGRYVPLVDDVDFLEDEDGNELDELPMC